MMNALDSLAVATLCGLVDWAVRALIVTAAVGVLLTFLRKKRAGVRHAAWTTVLVAILLMPAVGWLLPDLRWRPLLVLPPVTSVAQPAATTFALPPAPNSVSVPARDAAASGLSWSTPIAPVSRAPQSEAMPWARIALGLYALGALALLARLAIGWLLTHRLLRSSPLIEDAYARARLQRACELAGLRVVPKLAETPLSVVPMTMSATRPVIVLPSEWTAWSATTLDAVLIHEVAHVARRDTLVQQLSLIHRAVLWFNPLAWWLHNTLTELAEDASDEAVLATGMSQTRYAETVLGFFAALRSEPGRARWQAVAIARHCGGSRRVERILAWTHRRSIRLPHWILAVTTIVVAPVLGMATSIQPQVTSQLSIPRVGSSRAMVSTISPRPFRGTLQTLPVTPNLQPTSVRVIFEARDAQGQLVRDLVASDFRLLENGVERPIRALTPPPDPRAPPPPPPPPSDERPRAIAVVVDDLNQTREQVERAAFAVEQLRDLVLDDRDLRGLVSTGYSSIEMDLAFDRGHAQLNQAIQKLRATSGRSSSRSAGSVANDLYARHTVLRTTSDVLTRLGQANTPRKVLLVVGDLRYFSPGRPEFARVKALQRGTASLVVGYGTPDNLVEEDLIRGTAAILQLAERTGTKVVVIEPVAAEFTIPTSPHSFGMQFGNLDVARLIAAAETAPPTEIGPGRSLESLAAMIGAMRPPPPMAPVSIHYALEYASTYPGGPSTDKITIRVSRPGITATVVGLVKHPTP